MDTLTSNYLVYLKLEMSLIEPNLFLGDYATLHNPEFLETHPIGAIIDLIEYYPGLSPVPLKPQIIDSVEEPIKRYFFPMPDRKDINPFVNLDVITTLLDHYLPITGVYIHCEQGISRAPTIVAAYLMEKHGWTAIQALEYIRSKRPQIHPNPGFQKHLLAHEILLKDEGKIGS